LKRWKRISHWLFHATAVPQGRFEANSIRVLNSDASEEYSGQAGAPVSIPVHQVR
jgi:hypothetical protein